jgi:hypothetical protein
LGIGAAQKGAGSKPIERRHWVPSLIGGTRDATSSYPRSVHVLAYPINRLSTMFAPSSSRPFGFSRAWEGHDRKRAHCYGGARAVARQRGD